MKCFFYHIIGEFIWIALSRCLITVNVYMYFKTIVNFSKINSWKRMCLKVMSFDDNMTKSGTTLEVSIMNNVPCADNWESCVLNLLSSLKINCKSRPLKFLLVTIWTATVSEILYLHKTVIFVIIYNMYFLILNHVVYNKSVFNRRFYPCDDMACLFLWLSSSLIFNSFFFF